MGGLRLIRDPFKCEHVWQATKLYYHDVLVSGWDCRLCLAIRLEKEITPEDIRWAEEALKEEPNKESP